MISKKLLLTLSLSLALPPALADQGISQTQIDRLTKTMEIIQKNYIKKVDDKTLMTNAINGMVAHLDPHSAYLDKQEMTNLETTVSGEFVGIGVELTTERDMLRVISPINGSPAAKAGLKPGDIIYKVNGKLIQDMTTNEAINYIKGKPGTTVTLSIQRKGVAKPLIIPIVREVVKVKAVTSKLLSPGYGYVQLSLFQGPVVSQIREAITRLKNESQGQLQGLVLDLRNNPGGLLDVSADVVNLFLDKSETTQHQGLIVYTKGRVPDSSISFKAHDDDMIPHVPMIVLINGGSASASEITAGALQDYKRAIIMGTRSFGKGSVQTVIPITQDTGLKLTTALYYTPAGREIQARGIKPDVIVQEMSVDAKQSNGGLDFGEANYDNHIENKSNATEETLIKEQQKSTLALAKSDYQLYEALVMLKGMHAMK
ncbi:MAG: S41 family peptidase [Gammaproteobacteria bacterium]|nr:S41 family peptidase [Gammaproteobacteria bacterium]